MNNFNVINWALFVLSVALLVYFGVRANRLVKGDSESGFLLAGRSLGAFVGASTVVATGFSGWAFLGSPAVAYRFGTIELIASFMFAPAMVIGVFFFGNYLRSRAAETGSLTIPELVAATHASGNLARWIQGLAAALTALLLLVFLISQIKALGLLSSSLLGLPFDVSAGLLVAIIVIYTMTGGMAAIAWTDGVMVIGMAVGAVMIITAIFQDVGLATMLERLHEIDPELTSPTTGNPYGDSKYVAFLMLPYAFLFTLSLPYMANRILAFSDRVRMRDAALIVALFTVILSMAPIAGLYARAQFPPLDDPDQAMIEVIARSVGPLAGGVISVAVLFAVKSTANSLLHTISTAISHDLRAALVPDSLLSDKSIRRLNQWAVLVVGVIGMLGMIFAPPFMLTWLGILGTGTLLAAFSVPVLFPAIWQGNGYGALAALAGGSMSCGAMLLLSEVGWIVAPLLGCVIASVLYIFVSLATEKIQPRPVGVLTGNIQR